MATRLDEVHSHQFSLRRVVNALVKHDPDPRGPQTPRLLTTTVISAIIAALISVGYLIFNVVTGQGTPDGLRDNSTVLIEKETGAQYVYVKNDDRLHPVLNYTSGLLLTNGSGGQPTIVRRSRLADLRHDENLQIGATLGIPGAPNALPRTSDLTRDPWTICTQGADPTTLRSTLLVGSGTLTGGHTLTAPSPGATSEALLVQPLGQTATYLIFGNRKFLLAKPAVALAAFGWAGRQGQLVTAAWLNALPEGPDISAPPITDLGARSHATNAAVGRLLRAPGPNGDQWALVRLNDVQPISEVQARLLQADPATNLGQPVDINTSDFAKLPLDTSTAAGAGQLPVTVPILASVTSSVCARIPDAAGVTAIVVDPKVAATNSGAAAPTATRATAPGATVADQVDVPFGHGVLVRAVPSPAAPATSGTLSIVTDAGTRYAIADNDALAKLGYADATPLTMPSGLVSLVPAGPALSAAAATQAG